VKKSVEIQKLPTTTKELSKSQLETLRKIVGVQNDEIAEHILKGGVNALNTYGRDVSVGCCVAVQSLQDQKPKDAMESCLVMQATALYANGMDYIARANKADMLCHLEAYSNLAIKLLRLHNETIETLNRYRRGGEQKVTVTHIAEKMAVVNHFTSGAGGGTENQGDTPCTQ
jgi:hypothetical protein